MNKNNFCKDGQIKIKPTPLRRRTEQDRAGQDRTTYFIKTFFEKLNETDVYELL